MCKDGRRKDRRRMKSVYLTFAGINSFCMIYSLVTGKGLWWFAMLAAVVSILCAWWEK